MKTASIRKLTLSLAAATSIVSPGVLRADWGDDNPTGVAGWFNGQVHSGCSYDALTGSATRRLTDILVPGAVGTSPLAFTRTMNSRANYGSATNFIYYPFGKAGGWRHSYQWEIQLYTTPPRYDPCDVPPPTNYVVTYPDGRNVTFVPDGSNPYRSITPGIGDRFLPITNPGADSDTCYLLRPDGGQVRFDVTMITVPPRPENCYIGGPIYRTVFTYTCAGIIDPYLQETTITRYPSGAIDEIHEPAGRFLKLTYNGEVISSVQEYLRGDTPGRSVNYNYSAFGDYSVLSSVDYFGDSSLTARYTYQNSNATGNNPPNPPLIRTCNDSMYRGAMSKIAYNFATGNGAPHGFLRSERYFDGIDSDNGPAVSTLVVTGTNTRREDRGDGPSRTFTYLGGLLKSWTDFMTTPSSSASQEHYTSGGARGFVSYVIDARGNRTDFARNSITGNVTQITYPLTPSDSSQATRLIEYNSGNNPYYVMSVTNERQKTTTYTRDQDSHQATDINYPDSAHEGFHYNPFGQVMWHQRKNGASETFDYDGRGLLMYRWNPVTGTNAPEVTWPRTVFTYYPVGHPWQDRVQSVKDPRGNVTTFEYDRLPAGPTGQMHAGRGLVSKITHHDNTYITFDYDARGNKLWQENELRQRISYTYDDYNRVIEVKTPLPGGGIATTTYAYNPTYHPNTPSLSPYLHTTRTVTSITTPAGIITTHRYDENFRRTQTTQGAETQVAATTRYGYDFAGNLTSVIDPRNKETTVDYDERNRRTKVTSPPLSGSGDIQYATQWLYDPASNVRNILLPDGTEIDRDYDEMNRLLTNDLTSDDEQEHRVTRYTYWPSGRLKTLSDPNIQITAFEYDERDLQTKLTYPDETVLQGWVYDENGNMIERPTSTFANANAKQRFTYDDRNRLWRMRWSNGIDFSDFGYDGANRLTSAVNPYSTITRQYDEGGRLILDRQVLASTLNTPAITITPIGVVSRKSHGPAGSFDINLPLTGAPGIECRGGPSYTLVLTFASPVTVGGATVTSGIGSVASTIASGNVVTVNLTRVSNAQLITVKVFGLSDGTNAGELIIPMHVLIGDTTGHAVVNADDSEQTDSREGQVTNSNNFRSDVNTDGVIDNRDVTMVTITAGTDVPVAPAPGPQANVLYVYDDDGKVTRLSTPAYSFSYTYDGMGRPEWIRRTDNADVRYQYSYDASSNVIGRTSYTNDTSLSFVRDELSRITDETILLAGSDTFSHLHYRYDTMSRLISTLRDEDGLLDSFAYNFAGELDSAQYGLQPDGNGGFNNPAGAAGYVYDNAGNRLLVNGVAYTPNVLNQYTLAQGAPVGNGSYHEINSYQGVSYSYLADTQLAAVSSTAGGSYGLGYDALGRTVRRTANGQATYFIYDGARSILEYDASGNMTGNTLYGLGVDEIIARNNNGAGQFLMQDRLGSTVAVTGWKGELLEQYRYDAFGTPTIMDPSGTVLSDTAINNRILFAGREWVSRFGFYENRARAYHPGLGRFMSEDPMGFAAGDANLYRYCGNDPVNNVDPFGEDYTFAQNGNNINVRLPVTYTGGSALQRAAFTNAVQSYWSRQIGPYSVNVTVGSPGWFGPSNSVQIKQGFGQSFTQGNIIVWYAEGGGVGGPLRAAAHEGGHAMGVNHGDGLMAGPNDQAGNSPTERDVQRILQNGGRSSSGNEQFANLIGYAVNDAIGAVFNAAQTLGPGVGTVTVTSHGHTETVWSGRFGGGSFSFGGTTYFGGVAIRGLGSALISTGGGGIGGWQTLGYFPGGGEPGEGFHPPAEP